MNRTLISIGHQRHTDLLRLLADLDFTERQDGHLPTAAYELRNAILPFLELYGYRDEFGRVDLIDHDRTQK